MQVVQPDDAGAVLPRAAPPGAAALPQAADRDDAQEPAAPPARGSPLAEFATGAFQHVIPTGRRRAERHAERDAGQARAALQRARSTTSSSQHREERGATTSRSCASSSSTRFRTGRSAAALSRLPGRHAGRLGAGRAGEHGRVARTCSRGSGVAARPAFPLDVRQPARVGEPGHRLDDSAQAREQAERSLALAFDAFGDRGRARKIGMAVELKVPRIGESITEVHDRRVAKPPRRRGRGRRGARRARDRQGDGRAPAPGRGRARARS